MFLERIGKCSLVVCFLFIFSFAMEVSAADSTIIRLDSEEVKMFVEQGSPDLELHKGLINEQEDMKENGVNWKNDKDKENDFFIKNYWIGSTNTNLGIKRIDTELYFDLGKVYELDQVGLFTCQGELDVTFLTGEPGAWTELGKPENQYNSWVYVSMKKVQTRYLKVKIGKNTKHIRELKVCGTPVQDAAGSMVIGNEKLQNINLIPLTYDNIININGVYGKNSSKALVDEQPKNPQQFPTETVTTAFDSVNKNNSGVKDTIVIDLKKNYRLSYFAFYLGKNSNNGTIELYKGKEKSEDLLFSFKSSGEEQWMIVNLTEVKSTDGKTGSLETDYLTIKKDMEVELYEIACYSEQSNEKLKDEQQGEDSQKTVNKFPEMSKFMGMNGLDSTPMTVISATGSFREYHDAFRNIDMYSVDKSYKNFPYFLKEQDTFYQTLQTNTIY